MEADFWSTFWGAAAGAGAAFVMAHLKETYNQEHLRMAALEKVQMTLAGQMRRIQTYKRDFIDTAKQSSEGEHWYMHVPLSLGSTPETIDLESLTFLFDRRFTRSSRGFENLFVEIAEASNKFEVHRKVLAQFEASKLEIQNHARMEAKTLDELFDKNIQTVGFPEQAFPALKQIESALKQIDSQSEKDVEHIHQTINRVSGLFISRWSRRSGVVVLPFESAAKSTARQAYGAMYK